MRIHSTQYERLRYFLNLALTIDKHAARGVLVEVIHPGKLKLTTSNAGQILTTSLKTYHELDRSRVFSLESYRRTKALETFIEQEGAPTQNKSETINAHARHDISKRQLRELFKGTKEGVIEFSAFGLRVGAKTITCTPGYKDLHIELSKPNLALLLRVPFIDADVSQNDKRVTFSGAGYLLQLLKRGTDEQKRANKAMPCSIQRIVKS